MRVLLANSERGLRGGEHQTVALALGLRERGCDVCLCARAGSPIIERVATRVPVIAAPFEPVPFLTPLLLRRYIGRRRPDILHAQTARAHTHLRLARLLISDPPPVVVSRRVAFPVSRGLTGWLKYRTGIAHYIPISNAAADTLRDAGISEERMTVVPSGIDVGLFAGAHGDASVLERWDIPPGTFIVGTVAAFEKAKGYLVLLESVRRIVRRHPRVRFVWVGGGGDVERLRAAVAREGLETAVVVSHLDAPLETVVPHFDLFVLPSLREGLSTALIAALAAGVPVIASETGGIPEVLKGGCGLLVAPGDSAALARGIDALITDEGKRCTLAARGAERARRYDIGRTIAGTLDVYRAVLEAARYRRM